MTARPDSGSFDPESSLLSLLVRHYDDLVAYVRTRFGRPHFAQDVVQDLCLRLLERPHPDACQPLAMLRRMTHDAAVDRCRAEDARRRRIDATVSPGELACTSPTQQQQAESRQALATLVEAIHALPRRRRQVFVLHKIHGIPQKEIAARMDISLKMVEKHLRLAVAACRRRLEDA